MSLLSDSLRFFTRFMPRLGAIVIAAAGLNAPASVASPPPRPANKPAHVFGDPNLWQWPPNRAYHVLNYRLRLHFDQVHGEVFGDEVVTLRPFESHFRRFYLDSSELKIDSVTLERQGSRPVTLTYSAQDPHLWIDLDREYDAGAVLDVRVVYHGFPKSGLFFVNPTPDYPHWPREIWSQGEPETNHYWFPCWDYPNDMATSETITTVPDGQVVVSNGKLVSVTHAHGQTTYDWVESVPHSSYLTSLAIGPWRKVSQRYEDKPVDYYVPQSVDEATALRSFHLTPDMIGFFSRATGVDYPYEQYAQVTVQNYFFGGMENVSATTLTDSTLHDARADQDYPSTELVSHELGQHWFGDLAQGRDWANIWLNEGFATYMSALYTQYHEGNDAFRFEMYNDQLAALDQDRDDYLRPIVDRHYTDPMQMFDAITHEKGAAVLEMLRYVIDGSTADAHNASQHEPFFRALRVYLTVHRAGTADTDDLIRALSSSTGQELSWFFREWVYLAGSPYYHVEAGYDPARKVEKIIVRQTQQVDDLIPVFDMPVELAFYAEDGNRNGREAGRTSLRQKRLQIRDYLPDQTFEAPLDFAPQWVDFDPDDFIEKTVDFDQPLEALMAKAEQDPSMMSRLEAVQQLGKEKGSNAGTVVQALARVIADDSFYGVRAAAAASLGAIGTGEARSALLFALDQPDSRVRTAVVEALGRFPFDESLFQTLARVLNSDSSYAVQAAAAGSLGQSGKPQAFDVLRAKAATNPEVHVMTATLDGLAATKDPRVVGILIDQARPGVPERVRLAALGAIAKLPDSDRDGGKQELCGVVRAALDDPFLPVRQAGEELAGRLHFTQFCGGNQSDSLGVPTGPDRNAAPSAAEQLQGPPNS